MDRNSSSAQIGIKDIDITDEFRLLCSVNSHDESMREAIHALYYLPQNFKLTVLSQLAKSDEAAVLLNDKSLEGRIRFEEDGDVTKGTSPFSSAGAVIYSDSSSHVAKSTAPHVVLSLGTEDIESNGRNGFMVALGNPEALASAVLRIARSGQEVRV